MNINTKLMDDMMDSLLAAKKVYEALPALPSDIKPIYHRVLNLLYPAKEQGKELRVSDLSDALDIKLPNMTKLINDMTRAQLVRKIPSPQDGRVVLIKMTDKGNDYFENHVLVYRKKLYAECSELSEDDCYTMIRMINTIKKKIEKVYVGNGEN